MSLKVQYLKGPFEVFILSKCIPILIFPACSTKRRKLGLNWTWSRVRPVCHLEYIVWLPESRVNQAVLSAFQKAI